MSVISAYFPALDVPIRKGTGHDHGYWTRSGSKASFTYFHQVNGFGNAQFLVDILRNKYNHTDFLTGNWVPYHTGPYLAKSSGEPTPVPLDRFIAGRVIRVNNSPFLDKVKQGFMVVSHYRKVNALLKYGNGGHIITQGDVVYQNRSYDLFGQLGFPRTGWGFSDNSRNAFTVLGGSIAIGTYIAGGATPFFGIPYRFVQKTDDVTPYDAGWQDTPIKAFVDNPFGSIKDDVWDDLCTSVLGEANSRTVDILTAMAEMPETVAMILKAVREVYRMFRSARKGHIRLRDKAKRVQREHQERIHRINFTSSKAYVAARNERTRKRIELERQRAVAQERRNLAKNLEQLATAVSQVWLTYRYGIMPNVYLVEDLIKADQAKFSKYVRFGQKREIEIDPPEMTNFTTTGKFAATARCFVKRQFDLSQIANKEYSLIPAVTLWELVPLSFVADWFVNIGDWISATTGSTKQYTQASTISVAFADTSVQYLHKSGASVSVTLKGYTRKVIDPWHYCALRLDPFVDLQRHLDAASLSYQIFLKSVLKDRFK